MRLMYKNKNCKNQKHLCHYIDCRGYNCLCINIHYSIFFILDSMLFDFLAIVRNGTTDYSRQHKKIVMMLLTGPLDIKHRAIHVH